MEMKSCVAILAVGMSIALLPVESSARKIATHGNLTAHVDDKFVCEARVTVRVEGVDPQAFTDANRRIDLERLFATARASFEFDCTTPRVESVYLKGYVQGTEVYRGIGSAGADWVLLDVPFSAGKAAARQMQQRLGRTSATQSTAAVSKPGKEMTAADRLRLFGEKGEGAFRPLVAKTYAYRAQLMEVCKPKDGKQVVLKEMTDFYTQQLPAALPAAQAMFDSYSGEKSHYLPPCDSSEYKTTLAWNEKELMAQKILTLDSISNFSARVIEIKQHLSQLGFYKGPSDDTLDEPFLASLKRWFTLWYFGPVERLHHNSLTQKSAKAIEGLKGKRVRDHRYQDMEIYQQYPDYGGLDASGILAQPVELVLRQAARRGPGGIWMFVLLRTASIQAPLNALGYYRGSIDGVGTKDLDAAMQAYFNDHPELKQRGMEKLVPSRVALDIWHQKQWQQKQKVKSFSVIRENDDLKAGAAAAREAYWRWLVLLGVDDLRDSPNQMNVRLLYPYLAELGWLAGADSSADGKWVGLAGPGINSGVVDLATIKAVQSFQQCMLMEEEEARADNAKKELPVYIDQKGFLTDRLMTDVVKVWENPEQAQQGLTRQVRAGRTGRRVCSEAE